MTEKVKAVSELRPKYTLTILLKVSGLKRSTYYYVYKHLDEERDGTIQQIISDIFTDNNGRYGYRRITLELKNRGVIVNHKKVKRIMKENGLFGITPRAKYRSYRGDMNGTVKNLLIHKEIDAVNHKTSYIRDFSTTAVNEKWTTDVSEFHIAAGRLYLAPILDMYNDEIISYDISTRADFAQQVRMLNRAFMRFPDLRGLVFHSDQGWQYQLQAWHSMLKQKGIIQSMSRKGNCLDNSPIENFFG
ncbi:MAG: IS3 family transposase, partial [Lachnospiraceae bacterium]|nr:IS3 family transposase [Lachnospiraceae bacterium]